MEGGREREVERERKMGQESREERKEESLVVYCVEFRPSGKIKTQNKVDIYSSYKNLLRRKQ